MLKKYEIVAILIFAVFVLLSFWNPSKGQVAGAQTETPTCDKNLWQHVWSPDRLTMLQDCIMVSGVIDQVNMEDDGDYHIWLNPDSQYKNLLNDTNKSLVKGDLILEPVCENFITNPDAEGACKNFYGNIGIPPVGTHVSVTGSFVTDSSHGWNEIHPVTSLFRK